MRRYASDTSVSVERSKGEIERLLQRYGADQFMNAWDRDRAVIGFRAQNRMIRFTLPLPKRVEFITTPSGRTRKNPDAIAKEWEQGCRQRWRALALVIKAKLEAVTAGIAEFESEFLAYVVLPDGKTMGEWARPQIATAYEKKSMPKMLVAFGETGQ
jgi:hypothetical protein